MIVPESEADQYICPIGNSNPYGTRPCLGSKCMAWRFTSQTHGFCGMCPIGYQGIDQWMSFIQPTPIQTMKEHPKSNGVQD